MKEDKIKAYLMRVDKENRRIYQGYVSEIDNTLEAKQKFVGGTIQVVHLTEDIDIICNDNGKNENLLPNRVWIGDKKPIADGIFVDEDNNNMTVIYMLGIYDIVDVIVGNIIAVRHDDEGNFTSIQEEDIPVIESLLYPFDVIFNQVVFMKDYKSLPEYIESEE